MSWIHDNFPELVTRQVLSKPTKTAILMDLNELDRLIAEWRASSDVARLNPTTTELLFSSFLFWLRQQKRQENTNAQPNRTNR